MSIKQFELFHGIALTKILRSEKPVSVSLIETRPTEDWQVYGIIDVDLFVKHRTTSHPLVRGGGGYSWQFIFSPKEISRIIGPHARDVYVALVCGQSDFRQSMDVCFLTPADVKKVFPSNDSKTFSLTVKSQHHKRLRVIVDYQEKLIVLRDALERWEIPGR